MFTSESLMQLASTAEARYKELSMAFPAGTYHEGRNDQRREMDLALFCAQWLEQQGLAGLANVGPFMETKPRRGMRVRIKKGALVFATHPQVPREGKALSRAQVVTVFDVDKGYVDDHHDSRNPRLVQGKIVWVGTGGYWFRTELNNVELLDETQTIQPA